MKSIVFAALFCVVFSASGSLRADAAYDDTDLAKVKLKSISRFAVDTPAKAALRLDAEGEEYTVNGAIRYLIPTVTAVQGEFPSVYHLQAFVADKYCVPYTDVVKRMFILGGYTAIPIKDGTAREMQYVNGYYTKAGSTVDAAYSVNCLAYR